MIGISHLLSRRFDEALASLLLATQDLPSDFPDPYRLLVACYAHMGRLDDAREVLQRLRGMTPLVIEGYSYFRNSEHLELLLSGLHSAAGRDGMAKCSSAQRGSWCTDGSEKALGSDRLALLERPCFARQSCGQARKEKHQSQTARVKRKSAMGTLQIPRQHRSLSSRSCILSPS